MGLMFMGLFFFQEAQTNWVDWFESIWVFNIQRQDKERQKGKRQRRRDGERERRREGETETERMQELRKPIGISLVPTTVPRFPKSLPHGPTSCCPGGSRDRKRGAHKLLECAEMTRACRPREFVVCTVAATLLSLAFDLVYLVTPLHDYSSGIITLYCIGERHRYTFNGYEYLTRGTETKCRKIDPLECI